MHGSTGRGWKRSSRYRASPSPNQPPPSAPPLLSAPSPKQPGVRRPSSTSRVGATSSGPHNTQVLPQPVASTSPSPSSQALPSSTASPTGWAVGIEIDVAAIFPFMSKGGGIAGINFQYTSETGFEIYTVRPSSNPSYGFAGGASVQLVGGWGSGDWKGPFDSVGVSIGQFGGAAYASPDSPEPGWRGFQAGVGMGLPVGGYATQTIYEPWFGNR